jgi:hypothetical protein
MFVHPVPGHIVPGAYKRFAKAFRAPSLAQGCKFVVEIYSGIKPCGWLARHKNSFFHQYCVLKGKSGNPVCRLMWFGYSKDSAELEADDFALNLLVFNKS